ncbi:MAG: monofunctional biosynthetic peptidoglycan transglycosylase [Gammaproteobacteria bacterium]|nr:monofunctional biosynthetic peptidoglycan transglycosylase [Gammaproteobacteria bacterium]
MTGLFLQNWWRKRRSRHRKSGSRLARGLRWTWRIALVLLVLDAFYLMRIWPDWQQFGQGRALQSQFILNYQAQRKRNPALPPLQWIPVAPDQIPRDLRRAVVVAEDARFYRHHGIDLLAFMDAMDSNLELGKFRYGGSTISQQTIKNLYFSSARNPLRKWHELILTLAMEMKVSKQRILTTYLNIAEFGEGIYGVEAAAQYYWHIPASQLNDYQAAQLAATLPSPKKNNPQTRTRNFTQRVERIYGWMMKQEEGK